MKKQKTPNAKTTRPRGSCSTPTRSRRWRWLAVTAALCGSLTGFAQTTTENNTIVLAGSPELCIDPPNGVALVNPPPGGFGIDGNLQANVTVAGIGDWLAGAAGAGGYLVANDGTPIDGTITFHFPDAYTGAENNFQGGNKFNDNPNDWEWVTNPVLAKNNIHHAYMHLADDASGDSWVFLSADRESNDGDSYIDFEYLQNTMTQTTTPDGLAGGFISAGPHGGRTTNDFVISITFTKGGTKAGVCVWRWKEISTGVYDYVKEPLGDLDGSLLAAVNTQAINVPYGAFGNNTYDVNTFAEVAVNLTELVSGFDPCLSLGIKTVLVKTKTSQSPSATIVDFVAPKQIRFNLGLMADAGDDQIQCTTGTGEAVFNLVGEVDPGANGVKSTTWTQVGGQAGDVSFANANSLTTTATLKAGVTSATVRLTVVDNSNCTKSDDAILTAADSPSCILGNEEVTVEACSKDNEFTAPDADGTYLWEIEGDGTIVAGTETSQTVKVDAGSVCNGSFKLKLTINLANNCVSRCEKAVLVKDRTKPSLVIPEDATVECDNVPAPGTASGADLCSGEVTVEYLGQSRTDGSCANSYLLTRTWKATDKCGNATTKSQKITVQDTSAPTLEGVPPDLTVQCDNVPDPAEPTATDNCDEDVEISFKEEITPGSSPGNYTITRTWTAADNCGNKDSKSQTITVQDTTKPVISGVPSDATVECDSLPPQSNPTATDNCGGEVTMNFSSERIDGPCADSYTIKRTWTFTDANGNSQSATQTITVVDTTAPTLTVPANVTVECDAIPDVFTPSATDNCDGTPTITYKGETRENGTCADSYQLIRTWEAVDNCGNKTTKSQTITVQDTTDPSLTVPADVTVECDSIPVVGTPSATDNCDGTPTITYKGETRENGACADSYKLIRTWEAVDNCGNKTTKSQTITVQDTTDPSLTVPADVTVECDAVPVVGTPSAKDNCDSTPTITYKGETRENGACADSYKLIRTWEAVDNCGNKTTKSQTITVRDTTAPTLTVPANVTVECDAVPVVGTPSAKDNCDSTPTITYQGERKENGSCAGNYTLIRTWEAVDNCGNKTTQSQTITVRDTKAPSLSVPGTLTLECGDPDKASKIAAWLAQASASDTCATPEVNNTYSPSGFSDLCGETGEQTVTFSTTDGCNPVSKTARIVIRDTKAPVLNGVPSDQQVKCATELPPAPNVTASDACDSDVPVTFSEVTKPAVPFNMGFVTTRTWTATDDCGNKVTATQKITNLYCDDWPDVTGIKFYDANVNGIMDEGERGIAGWRIILYHPDPTVPPIVVHTVADDPTTPEDETGTFVIPHVPPGTYKIAEAKPNESSWKASTPMYYMIDLTDKQDEYVIFGNFCLGPGGGHTPGFWHNKNGYAKLMDGGSAEPELAMLSADYHLRYDTGADFDPTSHKSLAAWIRGNAVNMSYKLSTHTAAMALNVEANFVNASRLVYSPGCGNTGMGNNFITIRDLLANADALLAAYPVVGSDHPQRGALTCVKDTLDDANNNLNFVQYKPCKFTFPALPQ